MFFDMLAPNTCILREKVSNKGVALVELLTVWVGEHKEIILLLLLFILIFYSCKAMDRTVHGPERRVTYGGVLHKPTHRATSMLKGRRNTLKEISREKRKLSKI